MEAAVTALGTAYCVSQMCDVARDAILTPEERKERSTHDAALDDARIERNRFNRLQEQLTEWSRDRCSPIIHHSVADQAEPRIMFNVQQWYPRQVGVLKRLFATHRPQCGTRWQFRDISSFLQELDEK